MATSSINHPYRVFRYRVTFDKFMARASFSEVSGMNLSTQVVEYREGSDLRNTPRKLPGLTTFSNVTFRWGQTADNDFLEWVQSVAPNNQQGPKGLAGNRTNITVTLIDDTGNDGTSWTLINCWPVSYTVPDLSGLGNEVAITSLEVCCEGIWMNDGPITAGAAAPI